MTQSRKMSGFEAATNAVVGIIISWLFTVFVLPLIGVHLTYYQATEVTFIFFFVSTARSYGLRRLFNALQ